MHTDMGERARAWANAPATERESEWSDGVIWYDLENTWTPQNEFYYFRWWWCLCIFVAVVVATAAAAADDVVVVVAVDGDADVSHSLYVCCFSCFFLFSVSVTLALPSALIFLSRLCIFVRLSLILCIWQSKTTSPFRNWKREWVVESVFILFVLCVCRSFFFSLIRVASSSSSSSRHSFFLLLLTSFVWFI